MSSSHFWEVSWLARPDEPRLLSFEKDWLNVDRRAMPMPGERDSASIEYFHLGQGIDGFRTRLGFGQGEAGMLPVGELRGSLSQPILWLTYLAEGRCRLEDQKTKREYSLGRHGICIRHTDCFSERMVYDMRASVYQVDMTILDSALLTLLGQAERDEMLNSLGLHDVPSLIVKPMPGPITELMRSLLPDNRSGNLRILHSQAKALELLGALLEHGHSSGHGMKNPHGDRILARVHEELLECEGCTPSLNELAGKYGMPARQLNESFKQRYGSTIYAFMMNRRLDQAFLLVRDGQKPLKEIAADLGYGHVNNFLSAFKRRHGFSPGKLRGTGQMSEHRSSREGEPFSRP